MSQVPLVRIAIMLAVGTSLGFLVYYSPAFFIEKDQPSTAVHIKTGGTSSVFVIMDNRWRGQYQKDKNIVLDYESIGSTAGVARMIDGNYAVAFIHAPMTEKQKVQAKAKRGEVLQIPMVLCAVVPVYNLKELKGKPPLRLTGEVLAAIFLGKIAKWNDPVIKETERGRGSSGRRHRRRPPRRLQRNDFSLYRLFTTR